MAQRVNSEELESILNSEETVLADFYSDSCVPCKRMMPILSELEGDFGKSLKAVKINVASDRELAQKYEVQSVPTFILFRNGKETSRLRGAVSKNALTGFIKDN